MYAIAKFWKTLCMLSATKTPELRQFWFRQVILKMNDSTAFTAVTIIINRIFNQDNPSIQSIVINGVPLTKNSKLLLYGSVSQGLGTTKFTNLIGWNGYWPRSIFSHLDRHQDRQCFEVKKLQTKMQNHWLFSSNNIYFCKRQIADEEKSKEDEQT